MAKRGKHSIGSSVRELPSGCSIGSCSTGGQKAVMLVVAAVISFAIALIANALIFMLTGPTSIGTSSNAYWIGFFFVICFIISSLLVFRHDLQSKPENAFLCIVLCLTVYSSCAFYVNEVSWDVDSHYLFALEYSEPDRIIELNGAQHAMTVRDHVHIDTSLAALEERVATLDASKDEASGDMAIGRLSNLYKRIASLPSSAVIMATHPFGLPFGTQYVLGRLIYALIYSFVLFFGMRRLKSGKMLYASIALLPLMVILASNYSYDYWVNAFSMLGVAYLIGELQRPGEAMRPKNAIIMLGAFLIGLAPKAVYFPLVLLCLLMPRAKFATAAQSRSFRAATICTSLVIAASFVLPMLIGGAGGGDARGGSDVNASEQIAFILSNPLEYAQVFVTFVFGQYFAPLSIAEGTVGYSYLGLPFWALGAAAALIVVFLAITDKSPADKRLNTWPARIWTLCICTLCLVLVVTALYVSYTAVGSNTVAGCQPRYLLPLLFPFLAFIGTCKTAWPTHPHGIALRNACVLGIMAALYLAGLWQLYVGLLV